MRSCNVLELRLVQLCYGNGIYSERGMPHNAPASCTKAANLCTRDTFVQL
jgi:hypothetical protein